MWLIPQNKPNLRKTEKVVVAKSLNYFYKQVICDDFENYIIAFTNGECLSNRTEVASTIKEKITSQCICCARNLIDTNMVRKVFLHYCNYLCTAMIIFPKAEILYLSFIDFAKEISDTLDNHHNISLKLRKIGAIIDNKIILETLSVYMLDSNQDLKKASKMLSVHPNTMKYRLKQAGEKLGIDMNNRFEMLAIAKAIAVNRLLENQKKLL